MEQGMAASYDWLEEMLASARSAWPES